MTDGHLRVCAAMKNQSMKSLPMRDLRQMPVPLSRRQRRKTRTCMRTRKKYQKMYLTNQVQAVIMMERFGKGRGELHN